MTSVSFMALSSGLVGERILPGELAYRDACAGCGAPLGAGALLGGTLTCASCGLSFDLPRAGRCKDGAGLQLAPVPLLRTGGQVRVALSR